MEKPERERSKLIDRLRSELAERDKRDRELFRLVEMSQDSTGCLVYRQRPPLVDISGSVCGFGDFLPWENVPFIPGASPVIQPADAEGEK